MKVEKLLEKFDFKKFNVLWIILTIAFVSLPFIVVDFFKTLPEITFGAFENISQLGILIIFIFYTKIIKNIFNKIEIILFLVSFINVMFADFFFTIFMNFFGTPYKETTIILTMRFIFTLSYIFFIFFMGLFLIFRMKNSFLKNKFSVLFSIFTGTLFFICGLIFIISSDLYFKDKVNFYCYLFLTFFDAIAVGVTSAMIARSNKFSDFLFLQVILLLCFADLSIAHHEYMGAIYGSSPFEPAWLIGMMILFVLTLKESGPPKLSKENFTDNFSLRTIMSVSILIGLILFFLLLNYLKIVSLYNVDKVSSILLICFWVWFFSNLVSMQCSKLLIKNNLQIIKPNYFFMSSINNKLAEENPYCSIPVEGIHETRKIINNYNKLVNEANKMIQNFREQEKLVAISSIAKQVSHDIRSPLSALNIMVKLHMQELPEDKRVMIRQSIDRIQDIANNLLEKSKINYEYCNDIESTNEELISSIIEEIITEKRINFRSYLALVIESDIYDISSYGLFAKINLSELKRIISNLINNAVEAIPNCKGKVTVCLRLSLNNKINIIIKDNGKGIPTEILPKLGYEVFSCGKEKNNNSGNGLGLIHARTKINAWGGDLTINTSIGKGTEVIIELPRAMEPKWFVSKILLIRNQTIVILDDEQGIHHTWINRFQNLPFSDYGISIVHLPNPTAFREWAENYLIDKDKIIYLFDFEFIGYKETGLDLLEEYNLKNSILVTSHYENDEIRTRCEELGIGLIPKMLVGFVPLEILSSE